MFLDFSKSVVKTDVKGFQTVFFLFFFLLGLDVNGLGHIYCIMDLFCADVIKVHVASTRFPTLFCLFFWTTYP